MRLLLKRGRCLSWVSLRKTRRRPASRSARVQRCFCAKVRLLSVWDGAVALRKTTPICLSKSGFQWVSACGHVMSCLASSVRRKALMHQTDFLATGLSNGRRPRPPRTTTTAGRRRSWPISGVPTKTTNGVEPCRRDVTLFDTSHPCYGLIEASNIPKKRNTT